jgi:hypothetical protein
MYDRGRVEGKPGDEQGLPAYSTNHGILGEAIRSYLDIWNGCMTARAANIPRPF